MNFLRYIFLGLVAIVLIGVMLIYFKLDIMLKKDIEHYVSNILNTEVMVESTNFNLLKGEVHIAGLKVKNLPGFDDPFMAEAENILVRVELLPLLMHEVIIKQIIVDAPHFYVANHDTTTNFRMVIDDMDKREQQTDPNHKPTEMQAKHPFIIKELYINDAKLHIRTGSVMESNGDVKIMQFQNIGSADANVSYHEISRKVIEEVYENGIVANLPNVNINLRKTFHNIKEEVKKSAEDLSNNLNKMTE